MKNINISIIHKTDAVFWGKSCYDILTDEFKDYINASGADFDVEISDCCPLTDIKAVQGLIDVMGKHRTLIAADGNIKITNNDKNAENDIINKESVFLRADINKEKIQINEIFRRKIIDKHIDNGVYITDPSSVYIDSAAVIESGVTVYHNNFITGNSVIKKGCILMPNNTINNSVLCENVIATASTFNEAFVGEGTTVGPNAYLRPKAKIGTKCKIGDFVEVKNARIGNGTKVSHLAYVGDAEIGENCNIGCGVIFVNYNGKTKSKTVVGNNSFIGSNCNIIAPVNIGNKVFVAAGTTVTKDLKDGDFCIGRVRPEIKENMAKKYID
jgi:UDP-N-acetylglucosamine diphosphorylase/glucosamine-1-phosphate N-acetyltransferase